METTRASKHASKRIKERCGVSKKKADRISRMAYTRGTDRLETKGALRRWLDDKYSEGFRIVVWGDKAYLFSGEKVLVTVLQVPSELTRKGSYPKKTSVRPA